MSSANFVKQNELRISFSEHFLHSSYVEHAVRILCNLSFFPQYPFVATPIFLLQLPQL